MRRRVGILLYDGVSALEVAAPLEVFSQAEDGDPAQPLFDIVFIAEVLDPVVAAGGLRLAPHRTLTTAPRLDLLVLPGGEGAARLVGRRPLLAWLGQAAQSAQALLVTGTGALLAGAAGLLDGRRATTHWRHLARLREISPSASLEESADLVADGELVSASGPSSGLMGALELLERLAARRAARGVAQRLEIPWTRDPD